MNQKLHPELHPDADRLSVFIEGADTAREREQMLAHLAQCKECRDVVFLMQRPVEASSPARQPNKEWVWQRWFVPVGFAGVALAGLAALLLYFHPWTRGPGGVGQNVVLEQPEVEPQGNAVAAGSNPVPAVQAEKPKNKPGSGKAAMSAERQETGAAAELTAPKTGSHPASARATAQTAEAAAPSVPISTKAEAGPALTPNTQGGLNSNVIQDLPLRGRNVANVQSLATPPAPPAATPRDSLQVEQNLPALRVERPSIPDEKLSAVSGRVIDASGAVIPGATVVLREASGGVWQVATGADGTFQFTGIPDGHYNLTVAAPGFRNNQQSIDLKPSELAMVQPVLEVGAATQTVEVTASAPVLETSASMVFAPAELPSRLPASSSVSLGKRMLSLDRTGSLFLSRNAGKSWKKVHPQWTGKAIHLDLISAASGEAKDKGKVSGAEGAPSVFQLTTDSSAQWTSKDGTHWRPQ